MLLRIEASSSLLLMLLTLCARSCRIMRAKPDLRLILVALVEEAEVVEAAVLPGAAEYL
jgi:hypothetical protein